MQPQEWDRIDREWNAIVDAAEKLTRANPFYPCSCDGCLAVARHDERHPSRRLLETAQRRLAKMMVEREQWKEAPNE